MGRRKGKKKAKGKGKAGPKCSCYQDAGFAEALPMDVWLELMKRTANCPVHGDKAG